jgi:hypothetical protein
MGRRKKTTGKHRSGTGRKEYTKRQRASARASSGGAGGAGETAGAVTGGTGESTEAALVGILAPNHQIAPEKTVELLEQLEPAPESIPDNLAAEAAAAIGQAPEDPSIAPAAPVDPPYDPNKVTEWDMYMQMAVNLVAKIALPQWNLTDDEKNELTKSTAHILEDLFPGGLAGRYAPYLRLITVTGFIVVTRHKEHGGKLPGLGPKREEVVSQQ